MNQTFMRDFHFAAFVFDLDGTLVDSPIDFLGIRRALKLTPDQDILDSIRKMPFAQQLEAEETVQKFERQASDDSKIIEGAREFLLLLRESGKPTAILTRNSRPIALSTLAKHRLEVDLVIAREDAPPKPQPDGLRHIVREFGLKVSDALFIGDYLYDLQCGLNAGMPTALLIRDEPDFPTEGSAHIFKTFGELSDWLESKGPRAQPGMEARDRSCPASND